DFLGWNPFDLAATQTSGVLDRALRVRIAAFVEHEAMREHGLVGRRVANRHAREQRGVEPTAVLIASLEIQIDRYAKLRILAADRAPRNTRLDPQVDDHLLFAQARAPARREFRARRQEILFGARMPGRDAFLLEEFRDVLHPLGVDDGFAALWAIERRN